MTGFRFLWFRGLGLGSLGVLGFRGLGIPRGFSEVEENRLKQISSSPELKHGSNFPETPISLNEEIYLKL